MATRARWVATTLASTPAPASSIAALRCSPSTSAAHSTESSGWVSWTWPTRATPPRASPAYQAKNPRNIENAETYAKPAQASAGAARSVSPTATAVTGIVSGSDNTSAQEIVRAPPSSRESAPPSA